MYITRIRLENFKRHKEIEREFVPGVNAIFGPNGAGKTSFIEAVGFAFFDYNAYRKNSDIVRKGAKKATIWIDFIAPIDNRCYSLRRQQNMKTGGHYKLFDTATAALLCEGKEDVQARLFELLQIDPETNLSDLFGSILGVPQGTMTAVFLTSKSKDREKIFDPLLQVEVYKRTKEQMHTLYLKPLENMLRQLELEMERLQANVVKLPTHQEDLAQLQEKLQRNQAEHKELKEREPQITEKLQTMRKLMEALRNNETKQQQLVVQRKHIEAQQRDVSQQQKDAQQAQTILEQEADAHKQYQEAEKQLRSLRQREKEYRKQQNHLQQQEQQHQRLQSQSESLQKQLLDLQQLSLEQAQLLPALEEQKQLQQDREKALQAQAHLLRLQKESQELQEQLQNLESRIQQQTQLVDELLALQSNLDRLETITKEGQEIRDQVNLLQRKQQHRELLEESLRKLDASIEARKEQIEACKRQLDELQRRYQPQAEQLSFHEELYSKTQRQIAELESRRDREQQFVREVSGGVCPYFQESCRNVPPNQSLDHFITKQVQRWAEELQRLQQQQHDTEKSREAAKQAQLKLTEEGVKLKTRIASWEQDIQQKQGERQEVRVELGQYPDQREPIIQLEVKRKTLREEYKQVEPYAAKAKRYPAELKLLQELQQQSEHQKKALKQRQAESHSLSSNAEQLTKITQRLQELEAPCKRGNYCETRLQERPSLEQQQQQLEVEIQQSKTQLQQAKEALKVFGNIEQELTSYQEIIESTQASYQRYLAHQQTAQKLPKLVSRLTEIHQQDGEFKEQLLQIEKEIVLLREQFDIDMHRSLEQEERLLFGRLKELDRDISHQTQRSQELQEEIAKLTQASEKLQEKQHRYSELQEVKQCSDFIRKIYERAKPEITRLLIQSISDEAGRIFAQLLDDHRMHLKWLDLERDRYSLIVEEDGQERSFANLSGGEQMAAALALRMALVKELSSIRVAFFDEPTAHMDEDRRRNLANQLSSIQGFKQIFVISHDDTFDAQTHHTVRV